ncbi:hypothetical protein HDF23_001355 [Mucilaginibacter lappiensis]|uniref:Uncharacterized protein n=1 Tax=Mucilaginibacter lappiensis TaxID=354630 RepID=A0ABR6PFS8_9SPHI|nr:hypothetical protein [Mucilaginibacter lappiensis]
MKIYHLNSVSKIVAVNQVNIFFKNGLVIISGLKRRTDY